MGKYLINCVRCNHATSKAYARTHDGLCKFCVTGKPTQHASREVQHGRYIDSGPQAWDDQD